LSEGVRKAVIVHYRDDAMAALRAASEAGTAVLLLSPPGAALSLGAAVFKAMIDDARVHFPQVDVVAVLDCADRPGAAMNALRHGVRSVRLQASPAILRKIKEMAEQSDSKMEESDIHALDLSTADDALTACRKWLNQK
jgi:hypothetical protein